MALYSTRDNTLRAMPLLVAVQSILYIHAEYTVHSIGLHAKLQLPGEQFFLDLVIMGEGRTSSRLGLEQDHGWIRAWLSLGLGLEFEIWDSAGMRATIELQLVIDLMVGFGQGLRFGLGIDLESGPD